MRFFQATGPLTLPPGGFQSIVVAYIFAAPVEAAGCRARLRRDARRSDHPRRCRPHGRRGQPDRLTDRLPGVQRSQRRRSGGAERIRGRSRLALGQGAGGAGTVRQRVRAPLDRARCPRLLPDPGTEPGSRDLATVSDRGHGRSLLRTGQPADRDRRRRRTCSTTRTIASSTWRATASIAAGWTLRASFTLIAQFDYANTVMVDWRGQVNPSPGCAPELGINTVTVGRHRLRLPRTVRLGDPRRGAVGERHDPPRGTGGSGQARARGTPAAGYRDRPLHPARHRDHRRRCRLPPGRRSQRGAMRPARHRSAVRVRGPWRAERPAVFLCGHGVRHQLDSVGAVEPRVGETDQVGDAGQLGVEPGASRYCAGNPRSVAVSPSTRQELFRRSIPQPAVSMDRSRLPTRLRSAWRIWCRPCFPIRVPARCRSRWIVSSSARPTSMAQASRGCRPSSI